MNAIEILSIDTRQQVELILSEIGIKREDVLNKIINDIDNFNGIIKAMTAYGGECHDFDKYWNDENVALFKWWMSVNPKVSDVTLYRGYTFDARYFEEANIEEGKQIGVDSLTQDIMPAFTTDKIRATIYMNEFGEIGLEDSVRVLFVIHTTGKAFVDISELSYYPEESEYRCTDDVCLLVRSITNRAGYKLIELEEQ